MLLKSFLYLEDTTDITGMPHSKLDVTLASRLNFTRK